MEVTTLILSAVVVANFILGLFILLRNPLSRQGQLFFAMVTFINCWAITNHITDNALKLSQNDTYNRLAYVFALLAIAGAAAFTGYFTGRIRGWPFYRKTIALIAVAIASIFSVTNEAAGTVSKANGALHFSEGRYLAIYDLIIMTFLVYIIADLWLMRRRGNVIQRNQVSIIGLGFGSSILVGFILNAVIPLFTDNFDTAQFGPPLLSLMVVGSVSYAILKHRLFDIRLFVVRAMAYTITLAITALLYVIPSLLLADFILGIHLNIVTLAFLGVIILLTAILFQNLRNYFNKLTSKLFYRDYYEPQDVIDKIGNLLVGSVNLDEIKEKSIKIIHDSVKPSFTSFLLLADREEIDDKQKALLHLLAGVHADTAITDDIGGTKRTNLHQALSAENIAVSVRLRTKKEQLGFMVLGFKQSGSPYSETDMKLLGIIADEIAVGLQNALRFREIQRFNATLQEKIDEATKELRSANSKLKELDKTKDEFISMASHQLRTPLTSIKGYLSLILDGDVGEVKPKQQEMIQQAFDSASRMVYLIADLLNVSRLQSGKFVIINKPCNLADVVEGEYKQLADQAKNRQIKLVYEKPANFPVLNIDEDKVRQVVMNLMDNALYYTPSGGSVTVELAATPAEVTYKVTDTGVGVPKSVQHHLFSKFYRADNAKKMRPDGTGLGLYMTKKVITAQGGVIIFTSAEGKGSTFGFSLPRKALEVKG